VLNPNGASSVSVNLEYPDRVIGLTAQLLCTDPAYWFWRAEC
jgi:hypothetical protein